jgi:hypothetical protein
MFGGFIYRDDKMKNEPVQQVNKEGIKKIFPHDAKLRWQKFQTSKDKHQTNPKNDKESKSGLRGFKTRISPDNFGMGPEEYRV